MPWLSLQQPSCNPLSVSFAVQGHFSAQHHFVLQRGFPEMFPWGKLWPLKDDTVALGPMLPQLSGGQPWSSLLHLPSLYQTKGICV